MDIKEKKSYIHSEATPMTNIEKARLDNKMTKVYAAEKLNITRQTLDNWESGRTRPGLNDLINLSNLYNVSLGHLAGLESYRTPDNKFICETTGLSEESVQMFVDYKRFDDKRKRYEEIRDHPPKRKYFEDTKHGLSIEDYNNPEYKEAVELYRIEYNRASDEYRQEIMNLNRKYPHIPEHLVSCINRLLDSCRDDRKTDNIIDLLYKYAFSPLPQDIEVFHHYPGKDKIHRDYKGKIQSSDYLAINFIDDYDISELLRQSQLNDINFKLTELRREYKEKGEY